MHTITATELVAAHQAGDTVFVRYPIGDYHDTGTIFLQVLHTTDNGGGIGGADEHIDVIYDAPERVAAGCDGNGSIHTSVRGDHTFDVYIAR